MNSKNLDKSAIDTNAPPIEEKEIDPIRKLCLSESDCNLSFSSFPDLVSKLALLESLKLSSQQFLSESIVLDLQCALLEAGCAHEWKRIKLIPIVKEVLFNMDLANSVRVMLEDDVGWIKVADENEIQTFYRQQENTEIHSIKIKAFFKCPLINLICLLNEVDLIPKFFTLLPMTAECVEQRAIFEKLVYMSASFWPFNRDMLFGVKGLDYLGAGEIIMIAHSENGFEEKTKINARVRMNVALCGARLKLVDRRSTYIEVVFNIDPRIDFLPPVLLNFFTRSLAYFGTDLFRTQCKVIEEVTSVWNHRMQQNASFYNVVHSRIDAYFDQVDTLKIRTTESTDSGVNPTKSIAKMKANRPISKFVPSEPITLKTTK